MLSAHTVWGRKKKLVKSANLNLRSSQEHYDLLHRSSRWRGSADTETEVCSTKKSELPKVHSSNLLPGFIPYFFLLSVLPVHSASYFQIWTMQQGKLSKFVSEVRTSEKDGGQIADQHSRNSKKTYQ